MIKVEEIKENYILDPESALAFVRYFDITILKYGWISIVDVMDWIDPNFESRYIECKYGWNQKINMEKNVIASTKNNHIECKLNLPDYIFIEES